MAKANVFYFNPTCELAVANGSFSYMPPLLLQEMERDLAMLPFVFATKNDFVLTDDAPSEEFKRQLIGAGFELPTFCSLAELESFPTNSFNAIYPWGWSPAAHFKLKNLKKKCSETFRVSPVYQWTYQHRLLFERATSLTFLKEILHNNPPCWFINESMVGVNVESLAEIESLLQGHSAIVLKAPLSSSGRGIQIIRRKFLNTPNKQWISGMLKQQKYLIAEPFLDKLIDLSFQFKVFENSEITFLGYSVFETNSNGQYRGTFIHADLKSILPDENREELNEMIKTTAQIIGNVLQKSNYVKYHRGYIGVDAMIFESTDGLKMQPCIEVNCRMNMGVLTLFLENAIHAASNGKFELFFGNTGEFAAFTEEYIRINHPEFQNGKLSSGFLPLIEPDTRKKFGAYASFTTAK